MKKSYAITVTVALIGARLLQAAAPQPASTYLTLTSHLASSVAAACSFAAPQSGLSQLHCLPTSSRWLTESNKSETLCFFDKKDAKGYEEYASFRPWIRHFFGTSKAPDASCNVLIDAAPGLQLHCVAPDKDSHETDCFTDSLYCIHPESGGLECSENPGFITEYIIQQRLKEKRKNATWEALLAERAATFLTCEPHVKTSKDLTVVQSVVCPLEGEGIKAYLARVFSSLPREKHEFKRSFIAEHFMNEFGIFWDIPWTVRRYVLATLIETKLINVNDPLPISLKSPLELAMEYGDAPLAEFLLEKGACAADRPKSLDVNRYNKILSWALGHTAPESVRVVSQVMQAINNDTNLREGANSFLVHIIFQALKDSAFNQSADIVQKKTLHAIQFARKRFDCFGSCDNTILHQIKWPLDVRNAGERAFQDTMLRELPKALFP